MKTQKQEAAEAIANWDRVHVAILNGRTGERISEHIETPAEAIGWSEDADCDARQFADGAIEQRCSSLGTVRMLSSN